MQNFAKGLLDVADNLGRAAAAVPEEFRKSDGSGEEPSGAAKILISLLLGVEMTEKQLIQVYALQPFTHREFFSLKLSAWCNHEILCFVQNQPF